MGLLAVARGRRIGAAGDDQSVEPAEQVAQRLIAADLRDEDRRSARQFHRIEIVREQIELVRPLSLSPAIPAGDPDEPTRHVWASCLSEPHKWYSNAKAPVNDHYEPEGLKPAAEAVRMMRDHAMDYSDEILSALRDERRFIRLTLSGPKDPAEAEWRKVVIRPVQLSGGRRLQAVFQGRRKQTARSIEPDDVAGEFQKLAADGLPQHPPSMRGRRPARAHHAEGQGADLARQAVAGIDSAGAAA